MLKFWIIPWYHRCMTLFCWGQLSLAVLLVFVKLRNSYCSTYPKIHEITNQLLCNWVSSGQNVRPLNKNEYILDVATEAESVDSGYSLWFRRVVWTQSLRFENELSVAMQYNQVLKIIFSHSTHIFGYLLLCEQLKFCEYFSDPSRLPERPAKCSLTWKSERSTVPPNVKAGCFAA